MNQSMRKIFFGTLTIGGLMLSQGCAPSVTVTPAGSDRQYEISVSTDEFSVNSTEELIQAWHEKARETCGGGDYQTISRDVINRDAPENTLTVTGIIECK